MGILSGNPKNEPLHYGEVVGIWSYVLVEQGLIVAYQTFLNHAGDDDLKKLLKDTINQYKEDIVELQTILKENGVNLPPAAPEKPDATLEDIPVGARFQDPEIAASLTRDFSVGLVSCSSVIGQCIREDIALKFSKFHDKKLMIGAKLLRLTKEKGWLVPPPLHPSNTNK